MRWYDLFDRPVSRRDFMSVSRDVAGCLAFTSMPAEFGQTARLGANPFTIGVASGDPLDDGVVYRRWEK